MPSKKLNRGGGGERMVTRQMALTQLDSLNPLRIPEILQIILWFLPVKVLRTCRFVNKLWKDTALKPMRTKCGIISFPSRKFFGNRRALEHMENFLQCFGVDPGSGLLSDKVRDDIPCTKFEICISININERSSDRDKSILANFLHAVSPCLTEITLKGGKNFQLNGLELDELRFPSLKHAFFSNYEVIPIGVGVPAFSPWMSTFITNAPQLEKLDFFENGASEIGSDNTSLTSFLQVLKHKKGLKVKDLNIIIMHASITDNDLIHLSECDLKLKSLSLRTRDFPDELIRLLTQLLKKLENLESFSIKIDSLYRSVPADVTFPFMKNLHSLTIGGSWPGLIKFGEQMPSLERVVIAIQHKNLAKHLNREMKPASGVKELCFEHTHPTTEAIREAMRIFPNISKLEIPIHSAYFPNVYDSFPNLEELTLHIASRCLRIDGFLTGLSEEGCQNALPRLRHWTRNFDDSDIKIGTNHSPISVLTNLKLLRLRNLWLSGRELEINQVSLCLVLMKMPSLQILDFCERIDSPDKSFPQTVLKEFRKKCVILWKPKGTRTH